MTLFFAVLEVIEKYNYLKYVVVVVDVVLVVVGKTVGSISSKMLAYDCL